MSDYLPPEVWKEIFTRLPVKSIIRMRSVCKNFHLLISGPAFIEAHMKESRNSKKIILRYFSDKERCKKHKFLMLNDEDEKLGKINSEEIKFPAEVSANPKYCIVGSFNGLVCLCKDYLVADQIVLWNPSIRKCIYLPTHKENKHDSSFYCVFGFGFDLKNNDYKVVRLTYLKNNIDGVPPKVELFTLCSQSWRAPKCRNSFVIIYENIWPQTYLNGAVHWIGYEPNYGMKLENIIISFHMSDESFGKITFPDVLASESASRLSLSVFKNKLSVIQFETTTSGQEKYCIWLMEEFGQVGSWTKHCTIDLQGKICKMIDCRKNGELIMATKKGQLVTYDTEETPRTRNISGICGAVDSFLAVGYIDSLVLLDQIGTESVIS